MSHRPRKRFGQNFLQNQIIIDRILSSLNLKATDKVLEIGPGMGALTRHLLRFVPTLHAIEIDRDLCALLQEQYAADYSGFQLINADALTVDYAQWGKEQRVVGNLPYNISTPLLIHLLSYTSHIRDMHFMLQKEVVSRLVASPGSKDYGRLSVMVQYHCETECLFDVPPEAFFPKPKVDSAIIRLIPHRNSPFPEVSVANLKRVLAKAFSMRRKTLANNLKPFISASKLSELGIDAGLRPEQIEVWQYVLISNQIPMA